MSQKDYDKGFNYGMELGMITSSFIFSVSLICLIYYWREEGYLTEYSFKNNEQIQESPLENQLKQENIYPWEEELDKETPANKGPQTRPSKGPKSYDPKHSEKPDQNKNLQSRPKGLYRN